jgi:hypothetical protein
MAPSIELNNLEPFVGQWRMTSNNDYGPSWLRGAQVSVSRHQGLANVSEWSRLSGAQWEENTDRGTNMRYWPLVEQNEVVHSPFECEFVNPRVHAVRRRTLNFEMSPEPRLPMLDAEEIKAKVKRR